MNSHYETAVDILKRVGIEESVSNAHLLGKDYSDNLVTFLIHLEAAGLVAHDTFRNVLQYKMYLLSDVFMRILKEIPKRTLQQKWSDILRISNEEENKSSVVFASGGRCRLGQWVEKLEEIMSSRPISPRFFIPASAAAMDTSITITPALAASKLPVVVEQEAKRYLSSIASPATQAQYEELTVLFDKIKSDGVAGIWNDIKPQVISRMFSDVGSIYDSREDARFEALIQCGTDVDLGDLSSIEEQIRQSPGYLAWSTRITIGPS